MIPMPPRPYSPDLFPSHFFLFPEMEEVLKGKHFADVEEVKQKMAEAQKAMKIDESNTVWSSRNNIPIGVLHHMERTWKVTEV